MKLARSSTHSQGFTLIEVAVIVPIIIVTAIFLFNLLWSILSTSEIDRARLNMIHDRQTAVGIIEKDLALTSRYLTTIDSGLSDNYLPTSNGGTWSYRGDSTTSRVLILRSYSTTEHPLSDNRQPVFIGMSGSPSCDSANIYFNEVQRFNIIYFVKNSNLYRRHLVNTTTPTCDPQYQVTSCPSAADLGTSQHASCGADDELILRNVSNFSVQYYSSKTSTTPLDVYATGAAPALVTTAVDVEISITVTAQAGGQGVSSGSSLRISKLNADL
ncbi:MAG: hypothetical protein WBP12_03080 [Candidatus Saccharimonas sp.]